MCVVAVLFVLLLLCSASDGARVEVLPVLSASDRGELQTVQSSLKRLQEIAKGRCISIASVNGQARNGKSFFVNNLAGVDMATGEGSSIGGDQRSHTVGMQFLVNLDENANNNPEEPLLIFADTEGLGGMGQNSVQYHRKLILLSSIVSTTFFFNQKHTLDKNHAQFLFDLARTHEFLHQYTSGQGSREEISTGTPGVVPLAPVTMVLQDAWGLYKLTMSPKELLQAFVNDFAPESDDSSASGASSKVARKFALAQFGLDSAGNSLGAEEASDPIMLLTNPNRTHHRLFIDGEGPDLDALTWDQYEESYRNNITRVRDFVRRRASHPKGIPGGHCLTGENLGPFLDDLVASINDDIGNSGGEALVRQFARSVAGASLRLYTGNMTKLNLPVSSAELQNQNTTHFGASLGHFAASIIGSERDAGNWDEGGRLKKDLKGSSRLFASQNCARRQEKCSELWMALTSGLHSAEDTRSVFRSLKQFSTDIDVVCAPEDCLAASVQDEQKLAELRDKYRFQADVSANERHEMICNREAQDAAKHVHTLAAARETPHDELETIAEKSLKRFSIQCGKCVVGVGNANACAARNSCGDSEDQMACQRATAQCVEADAICARVLDSTGELRKTLEETLVLAQGPPQVIYIMIASVTLLVLLPRGGKPANLVRLLALVGFSVAAFYSMANERMFLAFEDPAAAHETFRATVSGVNWFLFKIGAFFNFFVGVSQPVATGWLTATGDRCASQGSLAELLSQRVGALKRASWSRQIAPEKIMPRSTVSARWSTWEDVVEDSQFVHRYACSCPGTEVDFIIPHLVSLSKAVRDHDALPQSDAKNWKLLAKSLEDIEVPAKKERDRASSRAYYSVFAAVALAALLAVV